MQTYLPRLIRFGGLAVAVLLAGCAGAHKAADHPTALPEDYPHHSAEQILQHMQASTDSLAAFRAQANFALNTPWRSGRFSGEVRHRRDDSLYMTLSPGLGIEAARILITPDSFFIYNRIEQEVIYGELQLAQTYLPSPFTTDDLFRNLLGIPAPEAEIDWQVEARDARYYLSSPDGRRSYTIDPAMWRVLRYEHHTADGTLIEDRTFLAWDRFDGVPLPRRIVFRRPADSSTATIYYRSITLNPDDLTFDLRVSSDARHIPAERLLETSP